MPSQSQHDSPRTPAAAQLVVDYHPTAEENVLINLSRKWMETAMKRPRDEGIARELREIMAPDYQLLVWDALRAPVPLERWLAYRVDFHFEYDALSAQVLGEIGVVYSRFWWEGTIEGEPFFDAGFLTDLWRRHGGSWQVFSRRSAPLEQINRLRRAPPSR